MKNYTEEQKKLLRDKIIQMQEASGLSGNIFATERLGFSSASKFSHVRNNWDKPNMVGQETWEVIEKYIAKSESYRGVPTYNLKLVWETCNKAYSFKKSMAITGDGGFGKTYALESYKKHIESLRTYRVVYYDASMSRTNKQFVVGLMQALDCYKPGTISAQLLAMREYAVKQDMLICIDEVSSMEGHNVTIIKDVMTAFKDICGIVFAGTRYFMNNLNTGAMKNKHLFSETRDRFYMLPAELKAPTPEEAELIFKANGIVSKDELDIVMGRLDRFRDRSWLHKKTYRGIKDCIDMIRFADMEKLDFNSITL